MLWVRGLSSTGSPPPPRLEIRGNAKVFQLKTANFPSRHRRWLTTAHLDCHRVSLPASAVHDACPALADGWPDAQLAPTDNQTVQSAGGGRLLRARLKHNPTSLGMRCVQHHNHPAQLASKQSSPTSWRCNSTHASRNAQKSFSSTKRSRRTSCCCWCGEGLW
jgi:hypothetical protein